MPYTQEQANDDKQFIKEQSAAILALVEAGDSVSLLGRIASSTLHTQITLGIIVRKLENRKNGS